VRRCHQPAVELAHIVPRGMGHKGDRDYLANVMAACAVHARSTDDVSSSEWNAVEQWADCAPDVMAGTSGTRRDALRAFVSELRKSEGWNI
jgi:tellurite resistance protein